MALGGPRRRRTTVPPPAETSRTPLPGWWPWGAGLLLGLVLLGPGLGGGSLLSLDLLVTPDIPVPNGVYGLGPALSQRVPLFALVGVGSALVGGPVAMKALLVSFVAVGFAGAARLARVAAPAALAVGVVGQAAAGLVWAGGPFAMTRLGVGHVNLVWLVAVLPWALPRLCRPADHVPSTFLAALLVAIGGPGGGTLGLAMGVVALALQAERGRIVRPLLAVVAPQAVWVLPTAVLLWAGAGVTGAGGFATVADGARGWLALPAGSGFWRPDYQVGATGWLGALVGVAFVALFAVGARAIVAAGGRRSWPAAATAVAVLGLVLTAASALPGVRDGYAWLSELPVGAPLRESQRFAAVWLVWAAVAVPVGAAVAGRAAAARWRPAAGVALRAVPLVLALALSVPGWWGMDGRLEPVDYPRDWAAARERIDAAPGTVVVLPWSEYPPLSFADGRQAFNPAPEYLGGDVISSYDPLFDPREVRQEQVDGRALVADELARAARRGEPIAVGLAELGVRWVFVMDEGRAAEYGSVALDPGLRLELDGERAQLYEVTAWQGPARSPDGQVHDLRRPVPPVIVTDAPAGSTLDVAGAPGWVRGWFGATSVDDHGRLVLGASGGLVWFWPAVALAAVDLAILAGAIASVRSRWRHFGRILAPRAGRG